MEAEQDFTPSKKNWRSFWSLLVMQTQNSFNDKAVQFILVSGAPALVLAGSSSGIAPNMKHVLAALVVIPFILLAPLAGWIGDRFAKSTIIKFSAFFQVAIFALLMVAFSFQSIEFLVGCFFLLAIQSAILSPAKIGVIKELVGKRKLGYASGMLEMFTILGILLGTIVMSNWLAARQSDGMGPWEAFKLPLYVLMACTPIAVLGALQVEKTQVKATRKFKPTILVEHFGQVWSLLKRRNLRLSSLAVTYFWVFGGFLQLLSVQISEDYGSSGDAGIIGADLANMMLAAGGGIALGSVIASVVSKRRIELGLVPVGGIIMTVTCGLMAITEPLGWWFMSWMFVSGIGAAFFLVPVNAYLQDSCEEKERGNIIAANNLLNCLGGISAVAVQFFLQKKLGLTVASQFMILGVVTVFATAYATRLLPREFFRFTMLMVIRIVYRIRIENDDKMPNKGGVLLVPNHMSYLDAFIISAASPRPVRFLMFDEYFKKGWMVWFLKLFNTVPISRKRSKQAIQVAADAVAAGDVVCIFPEGQLSRTGTLSELKRGFEMIARKATCPVLPVHMDGLWGSIFSFERGKYIYKWPYRLQYGVTVNFADPLQAREATNTVVRERLLSLSADSMVMRKSVENASSLATKHVNVLEGDDSVVTEAREKFAKLSKVEQRKQVLNALQIGDGPVIQRADVVAIDVNALDDLAMLLLHVLPVINRNKLVLIDGKEKTEDLQRWADQHLIDCWIGSADLWQRLDKAKLHQTRYDLTGCQKEGVFPWWVEGDRVLGVSVAHPEADTATNQHQPGHKEDSRGRLLAGYYTCEDDGLTQVFDRLDEMPITESRAITFDSEGFVKSS